MAHGIVIAVALIALMCAPCLLAVVIFADLAIAGTARAVSRTTDRWRLRRETVRLERSTGIAPSSWARLLPRQAPPPPQPPADPPFEMVAAHLRRLARQRTEVGTRSPVWFAAVHHAYDDRLRVACRELGIPEYLHELDGVDLEIERVRVEGLLAAAGLRLAAVDADGRQDTW